MSTAKLSSMLRALAHTRTVLVHISVCFSLVCCRGHSEGCAALLSCCQLSHGCQQLLLRNKHTHSLSYTQKQAFFHCSPPGTQEGGLSLCPATFFFVFPFHPHTHEHTYTAYSQQHYKEYPSYEIFKVTS